MSNTRNKKKNVASKTRGVRLFLSQEEKVEILEKHGFSFQKLAREGVEKILDEKLKLIGIEIQ
ncbi:hypothetical protein [Aquitalea pelogenes]|uniref:hypothetical protein n=1 Tax=Aquitalea pelogenes TaxID=1293573 RepID=UPI0035B19CE1